MIERARGRIRELFSFGKESRSSRLENPLTLEATRLFVEASSRYPASVVGQGLSIALSCKGTENSENIGHLRDALLSDRAQVNTLVKTAQVLHNKHGKGPRRVSRRKLRGFIKSDFTLAESLAVYDADVLTYLQRRYFYYFRSGKYDAYNAEIHYRDELLKVLELYTLKKMNN